MNAVAISVAGEVDTPIRVRHKQDHRRWSSLIRMSGDRQAAAAADAMQAEYFKRFLEQERSESAARLPALNRRLTECLTTGQTTRVSHLRSVIRAAEGELRGIDRMIDALRGRFTEEGGPSRA